jgi:hypothetical protein
MDAFLTIRDSRFERALPCRLDRINQEQLHALLGRYASVRCDHQDLIELFGGNHLRFEHNRFGVYERGGAQLYITGVSKHDTVADNTFVGTDPRVPGYRSRVGVLVGGNGGGPIPTFVRVVHNKIYTGAKRLDGYEGSISISLGYGWRVPVDARPLIAHNVLGLLETPTRVCNGAKMVANVILRGHGCRGGPSRR